MMTIYKNRWTALIVVGFAAGLIQVIAGVSMYIAGLYFTRWSIRLSLVLLAICIAAGIWWYRKHVLGGRTTYWSALLAGIVIAVCTGLTYVTYNVISVSFVYRDFLGQMVQAEFEREQAMGMHPVLESLRAEATLGNLVAGTFMALARFGTVLSALIAIAFRRKRTAVRAPEAQSA
jgi:hypothetical protein